jgi:hypothetical protein
VPKKILPDGKVCVAYIHPGQTSAYFTTSLLAMMLHDRNTSGHITALLQEWSSANVSASRNNLVRIFLDDKDAEWLLFIDADMAWDHDAVDRLLASANQAKAPIVGGLCFGANMGRLFPTIYQLVLKDGKPTTIRVNEYEPDSLVKCSATGAAFLLINRAVLVEMREKQFNPAFPWFQEMELSGAPSGEDITFCLRAGQLGYPVHVDTSVKVGHHKSHVLTEDMFLAQ